MHLSNNKQLLDEDFVISGIIKVKVSVISLSLRLWLITLTSTLIIPDITKTESNNCFIIHCFFGKENNDKRFQPVSKLVLIPACRPAFNFWMLFPQSISWNSSFPTFVSRFVFSETLLSRNFSNLGQIISRLKKQIDDYEFPSPPDAWHICSRKSCIARATYRLVNNLLADYSLICRLRGFPELAVGS